MKVRHVFLMFVLAGLAQIAKADTLYQYSINEIYVGQNTCGGPCTQSLSVTFLVDVVQTSPGDLGPWRADIPANSFTVTTFGVLGSTTFDTSSSAGLLRYFGPGKNFIPLNIFGNEFDLDTGSLTPFLPLESSILPITGELFNCTTADCANAFGFGQTQTAYHFAPAFDSLHVRIISTPEPSTLLTLFAGFGLLLFTKSLLQRKS